MERIVNEPTAAALAYGLDKLTEKSKIAVYDLGGGTFDLSILELNEGVFQVLSTNGNTRLGGDDLDKRLIEYITDKIKTEGGPNAASDLPLLARIREAAEQAKIRLSTEESVEIALSFITPDFHFRDELRRSELRMGLWFLTCSRTQWPMLQEPSLRRQTPSDMMRRASAVSSRPKRANTRSGHA